MCDWCPNRSKRHVTQNQTTATPLEIHNLLSTTQQNNWLAGQTRPDLNCQISLARRCTARTTVGQIRRTNAWVSREHQFADLKLTFLNNPPEQLRLVIHTDYFSRDPDGIGRTKIGYIIGTTNPSELQRAPWAPLCGKRTKLKQRCTYTSGLRHLEWIM